VAAVSKPPAGGGSSSKLSAASDPDARKMIGELPVLLQDLSQSKLLLKFKQQESSGATTATPTNDTAASTTNVPAAAAGTSTTPPKKSSISSVAPNLPPNNRELSNVSNTSAGTKSITSEQSLTQSQKQRKSSISNQSDHTLTQQNQSKSSTASVSPQVNSKIVKQKTSIDNTNTSSSNTSLRSKLDVPKSNKLSTTSKLTPLSSGIYGVEDSIDSGVYGADSSTLVNTKPLATPPNHVSNKNTPPNGRNEAISVKEEVMVNKKIELTNLNENNNQEDANVVLKSLNNNTTPRKTAFNPLHVILKDKNKYHTTEYI
jgi:hypothetical protein